MTEVGNFCFNARVGTDRYRLALLPSYPRLLQLREIVKRLAVLHKNTADRAVIAQTGICCFLPGQTQPSSDRLASELLIRKLRQIEQKFENAWERTLEAAGVLSNSFAPFPAETCNDQVSSAYQKLWRDSNSSFFEQSVTQLNDTLSQAFQQLQLVANGDVTATGKINESRSASDHESDAKSYTTDQQEKFAALYKQTRLLETRQPRLKSGYISSITLDSIDEPHASLVFPVNSGRLLL